MNKKLKSLILNGTRGSSKPHLQTQYALSKERDKILDKKICGNCSDYELCLRDNSKCYQYLEEEKELNVGKEKRFIKRSNSKDL